MFVMQATNDKWRLYLDGILTLTLETSSAADKSAPAKAHLLRQPIESCHDENF